MKKTRKAVLTGFALAAALILSSCSQAGQTDTAKTGSATLTVAQVSPVVTMDPAMHRDRVTQTVVRNVFEALVNQDDKLAPVPELATAWTQVNDTMWRFTLREGVKFHNGEEFNAEAVKYSLERVLDPKQKSPRASMLSMIESVTAEDKFTVVITTRSPAPTLLASLAVNEIVPPAYVKEVGDEKFAAAPVGTGPFTFSNSENSGSRVVLEKNDDYWGGAPRISRLVFDTIPEVSSRMAALQSGTVNIATNIPPDLAETLGGATKAVSINGTRIAFLAMNVTKAPFNEAPVRKAMNQAIDKKAIVDGLYLGYANTVNQPAFPEMIGYSESFKGYEYNSDSASAVLSRTTTPITIDVKEENRVLAEAIVGQLQSAGLDAEVRVLEALAFTDSISSGASQAYINTWGVSEGDADVIFARHFWSEGRAASFDTGYSNPDVDKLIIAGRSTLDANQRKDIYAQATELVMDDAPWVPLFTAEEIYGVSTKVDGWKPSPIGRIDVKTVNIK